MIQLRLMEFVGIVLNLNFVVLCLIAFSFLILPLIGFSSQCHTRAYISHKIIILFYKNFPVRIKIQKVGFFEKAIF